MADIARRSLDKVTYTPVRPSVDDEKPGFKSLVPSGDLKRFHRMPEASGDGAGSDRRR
jgi:hypothetical protein